MRASAAGIAFARAIDSVVREAGRIVVCVEASAEVSTASTTIWSHGVPSTSRGEGGEDRVVVLELGDPVQAREGDHGHADRT